MKLGFNPYNYGSGAYYWLGGSGNYISTTLGRTLWFNQSYRPIQTSSQYRKVVIYLTPVAAPNYLRVDAYIQFGYNQPLTPLVTGLMTGVQVPASVMIGYAARAPAARQITMKSETCWSTRFRRRMSTFLLPKSLHRPP